MAGVAGAVPDTETGTDCPDGRATRTPPARPGDSSSDQLSGPCAVSSSTASRYWHFSRKARFTCRRSHGRDSWHRPARDAQGESRQAPPAPANAGRASGLRTQSPHAPSPPAAVAFHTFSRFSSSCWKNSASTSSLFTSGLSNCLRMSLRPL
eukprot:scaffold2056_cov129-Isochrysis_galbana.AAC.10